MVDIVKYELNSDSSEEEISDVQAGLEEGYEEAATQLTAMLESAGEDEDSSNEYKRGFFLGYAAFFSAWLDELEQGHNNRETLN